jgi:hypothetical protein
VAKSRTTDTDKGRQKILKQFDKHNGSVVDVGFFFGDVDKETGFPIAAIAAVNEYGSQDGRIPERPFMRNTLNNNKAKYRALLRKLVAEVAVGTLTNAQALERFGAIVKSDIQREITALRTPANADSTVAQKGFDNPLINEGTMRKSVDYKVSE